MNRNSTFVLGIVAFVAACGATGTATGQATGSGSTLVRTGNPAAPFVYSRDALRWTFRNDGGTWTDSEASATQAALDRLPLSYLRRVEAGGGGELRRQGRDVHQGPVHIDRVALAAFGFTALADGAFDPGRNPYDTLHHLLGHEFGHHVEKSFGTITYVTASDFARISWGYVPLGSGAGQWGKRNFNSFPTKYGLDNPWEDFADACVLYWFEPDTLRTYSPEKYAYMRDRVFDRLESTPATWERYPADRNPRGSPTVTSVSPARAERLAWVTIRGDRYLDVRDAAPTRVRFGGNSAVSLAVSRTTAYAQVPWVSTGSQPVTIETPDGVSARAAFEVTRPWWQVW